MDVTSFLGRQLPHMHSVTLPVPESKTSETLKSMSIFVQALEFEAGQRNWLLQQDALHTAASVKLRQQVAASQAAVEAQRSNQLADWAAEEQEEALKHHQARTPPGTPKP